MSHIGKGGNQNINLLLPLALVPQDILKLSMAQGQG